MCETIHVIRGSRGAPVVIRHGNFKDPASMLERLSKYAYTVKHRIQSGKTAARRGPATRPPSRRTAALVRGAILWETFAYLYVA